MDIDHDRLNHTAHNPRGVDRAGLANFAAVLAATRSLEDEIGVDPVYGATQRYLALAETIADEARGDIQRDAIDLAGQWAQYTGWLHIAAGHFNEAAKCFAWSLEWADDAEDDDLAATVWSWRGHLAWVLGHTGRVISLSRRAQRYRDIYAGERAYDCLQEARGHAVAGSAYMVDRLVDESHELAEQALLELEAAPPWHYYRSPEFWDLERGRALSRLPARAEQAVTYLEAGLAALPESQRDTDWITDYRRDLEHAQALCG